MTASRPVACPACGHIIPPEQPVCICGRPSPLAAPRKSRDIWIEKFDFGTIMPWVPIVGTLLLVLWIISPPLSLQYSNVPLYKVYGLVVLSTALLSLLESERFRRLGREPDEHFATAITSLHWFLYVVLVWPASFPVFLVGFFNKSHRRRMQLGVCATAAFMIALLLLFYLSSRRLYTWPETIPTAKDAAAIQPPPRPPAVTPVPQAPPLRSRAPTPAPTPVVTPAPAPVANPPDPHAPSGKVQPPATPQNVSSTPTPTPAAPFKVLFFDLKKDAPQ